MLDKAKSILVELSTRTSLTCSGAMLFGSRARKDHDCMSDWDLMVLVPDERVVFRKELYNDKAGVYDISVVSKLFVTSEILARSVNQCFLLNAFEEGLIVFDDNAVLTSLKEYAHTVWCEGPAPYAGKRLMKVASELNHGVRSVQHAISRVQTPVEEALLMVRCSELFRRIFYLYCQQHGIWAGSIRVTMRKAQTAFPDLYSAAVLPLLARSAEERVKALQGFLSEALTPSTSALVAGSRLRG